MNLNNIHESEKYVNLNIEFVISNKFLSISNNFESSHVFSPRVHTNEHNL
jgi:hypothetical protein